MKFLIIGALTVLILAAIRAYRNRKEKRQPSLLKTIDHDLNAINKQLLFLDLGWDAYVYTALDKATFTQIIALAPNDFHGADKVK